MSDVAIRIDHGLTTDEADREHASAADGGSMFVRARHVVQHDDLRSHEVDLTLTLPRGSLVLRKPLLATDGFDGLVDDGFRIRLFVRLDRHAAAQQ